MIECIIFDLDGTLVDSEPLCNQAFIDTIPDLRLPLNELIVRFRGRKLTEIFKDIESMIGHKLPDDIETTYRARVEVLFQSSLETFPDVYKTLQNLDVPICIASNGPQNKIKSALVKTKLIDFFDRKTFSSFDIGKWKPDPGLFLHAASEMGVDPHSCIVVEDSAVGIKGAQAAGMIPLQFSEEPHENDSVTRFNAYRDLPDILASLTPT